ncbi:3-dehydroquinate synthase [Spatholobus suberectus]|nr:3-dehydroquinate synthase [Spatholobus suberectus]
MFGRVRSRMDFPLGSEDPTILQLHKWDSSEIHLEEELVLPILNSFGSLLCLEYFVRRVEGSNLLSLTKVIVTHIQVVKRGGHICVDLYSLMKPGWIFYQRIISSSIEMLGVKLHYK